MQDLKLTQRHVTPSRLGPKRENCSTLKMGSLLPPETSRNGKIRSVINIAVIISSQAYVLLIRSLISPG